MCVSQVLRPEFDFYNEPEVCRYFENLLLEESMYKEQKLNVDKIFKMKRFLNSGDSFAESMAA